MAAKKRAKKAAAKSGAAARKKAGAKSKAGAKKKAGAKSKAGAKKKAAAKPKVGAKKKAAAKPKADSKKAAASTSKAVEKKQGSQQEPDAAASGGKDGQFSAADVNVGHIFALRPRVNNSFRQPDFRTAKHQLQDERYETIQDAARAVAEKALTLTHGGSLKAVDKRHRR